MTVPTVDSDALRSGDARHSVSTKQVEISLIPSFLSQNKQTMDANETRKRDRRLRRAHENAKLAHENLNLIQHHLDKVEHAAYLDDTYSTAATLGEGLSKAQDAYSRKLEAFPLTGLEIGTNFNTTLITQRKCIIHPLFRISWGFFVWSRSTRLKWNKWGRWGIIMSWNCK